MSSLTQGQNSTKDYFFCVTKNIKSKLSLSKRYKSDPILFSLVQLFLQNLISSSASGVKNILPFQLILSKKAKINVYAFKSYNIVKTD